MTKVLVTGATGFLGGHILTALGGDPGLTVIAACRTPGRLPAEFGGEVRPGDLTDPVYRRDVIDGIDVVCHAGTWAAFWGHRERELERFHAPALDLIAQCRAAGVGRFVLASTVAAGAPGPIRTIADRDRPPPGAEFWPHLDLLIDLERRMRTQADARTALVSLRLGHFVGPGNSIGLIPALAPRLRTRLVPWLAGGKARFPLVTGEDLGQGFACAVRAELPEPFDAFAMCGPEFPTAREVIGLVAEEIGTSPPRFSVPFPAADLLARVCEWTKPVVPGPAPFLTRSTVHLARDWYCPDERATAILGYRPTGDWRTAVRAALSQPGTGGWPSLVQS